MWKRDFAPIKAMGADTVRLYGWNATHDQIIVFFFGILVSFPGRPA